MRLECRQQDGACCRGVAFRSNSTRVWGSDAPHSRRREAAVWRSLSWRSTSAKIRSKPGTRKGPAGRSDSTQGGNAGIGANVLDELLGQKVTRLLPSLGSLTFGGIKRNQCDSGATPVTVVAFVAQFAPQSLTDRCLVAVRGEHIANRGKNCQARPSANSRPGNPPDWNRPAAGPSRHGDTGPASPPASVSAPRATGRPISGTARSYERSQERSPLLALLSCSTRPSALDRPFS